MDIWEISLKEIESTLTRQSFENWFKPTKLHSFQGNTVMIGVPNVFLGNWLKNHFIDLIKSSVKKVTGIEDINIDFVVCEDLKQVLDNTVPLTESQKKKEERLNQKYTFASFVVGPSNQFAHAATRAVAEAPGLAYNPLFIYSGVGLGKTHLLHAIGNHIALTKPSLKILYVSSEQFTNEVIQAILNDKTVELRNKYRTNTDILLMDDIQFIAGKERTVEEFFHTFNTLYEARKQIVITSDKFQKEIKKIQNSRLRFQIEKGVLLLGIQRAQGVTEKRSTSPIFSNVLLEGTTQGSGSKGQGEIKGQISIVATDLEIGIKGTYPARVHSDGGIAVSGKKLHEIIRELPEGEVDISVEDGKFLTIKSGNSFFKVAGSNKEDFPI